MLDLGITLPCYESCWEAGSALECFQRLQIMPPPVSLSLAIKNMRAMPLGDVPVLETSGFGMFVLIKGYLHHSPLSSPSKQANCDIY